MSEPSTIPTLLRSDDVRIETGQGIRFSLQPAGPVLRFLALMVDLLVIFALTTVTAGVLQVFHVVSADIAAGLAVLFFFVISIGYGIVLEWIWRGQTPGKKLFQLRVVDARGLKLHPSQIIMRNLLRPIDMLPAFYFVGGLACLLSPRSQRLGDLAAGTLVVHLPRHTRPDLDAIDWPRHNSLRAHPRIAAALRRLVTPAEAAIGLEALIRRDRLEPEARLRLFAELADSYRAKVRLPDSATRLLSDEQLVRNVLDIVYRPQTNENPPSR